MKRSEIERLLPEVFQRSLRPETPLWALLEVMQALQEPAEAVLAEVHTTFNPYRTGEAFVPFLARWVDLERFCGRPSAAASCDDAAPRPLSSGLGPLRELVAVAAYLSQWRGTARGLKRFLETATGAQGFELDEHVPGPDGLPRPFHVKVRAPERAARHQALIERIVEHEKPAYVTYELEFSIADPE